jgi:N-methylhydantoinase A
VALARELAIPKVLVPARPGITSALGCLVADVRHDFVKTINQDLLRMDVGHARAVLAGQVEEGRALLASEGVAVRGAAEGETSEASMAVRGAAEGETSEASMAVETVTVQHEADMQFIGQTHVLTVPIARTDFDRDDLRLAFEKAYWERFEVELKQMRAQVVSVRTAVIGRRQPVSLEGLLAAGTGPETRSASRRVWFESGWTETPIYRREQLPVGAELTGPAIVEQLDSTTVIEPGDHVRVDALGNLEITVRALGGQS